jgi:acyl-coenzyme A synthetase/AMP-(fatty) acid ligase
MFHHQLLPPDVQAEYHRNGYWEGITLAQIVQDWAEREPARPAVTGPRSLSYGDLWEGARRLAGTLLDSGMRPGEFLLAMMSNSWQGVVLEVAASVAGLVFAPRSLHMSPTLAMTVFEQIDAGGVVVQADLLGSPEWRAVLATMRERRPDRPIMVQGERSADVDWAGPTLEEAVASGPIVDRVEHDPGRPCLILSTGGTTGRPKSIVHCSDTLVYASRQFGADTEYSGDDVHVAFGPYGHAGGSVFELYMPLMFGASILPIARWQPRAVAEAIHRWKGTYFITMGTHVYDLLGLEPHEDALLASVRLVTTGAGPDELFEAAQRRFGCTFVRVYGCSEVPGHAIGRLNDPAEIRLRRDGVPFAGMDHRLVVPDSTQPSEKGAAGEYQCRGPNLFMGYLGDPELTSATVTEDGFYRSGDLMTETDDGYVTWSGRLKDIIRRGGLQLDPVEMENLLSSHPRIAEVAVVGEPDPRLGERAVVVVVPADAGDAPDLDDVCSYLVDHGLPKANLPERVVVVASLPRTEVGKIHRVEVKRRLTAEPATAGDRGDR